MAKKNKTEKTNLDYYKSFRGQYIFCRVLTYIALILPMIILVSVNFNKYFDFTTDKGKLSFSLSLVVLIFCTALAILQTVKKIEDKKYTLFINAIYWLCASFLCATMSALVADIGIICACISGGVFLCGMFNLLADNRKAWLDDYRKGLIDERTFTKIKDSNKEEKKESKETKKVEAIE